MEFAETVSQPPTCRGPGRRGDPAGEQISWPCGSECWVPMNPETLTRRTNLASVLYQDAGGPPERSGLYELNLEFESGTGFDIPHPENSRANLAAQPTDGGRVERRSLSSIRTMAERDRVLGPALPRYPATREEETGHGISGRGGPPSGPAA